jgi:hypothetical protein
MRISIVKLVSLLVLTAVTHSAVTFGQAKETSYVKARGQEEIYFVPDVFEPFVKLSLRPDALAFGIKSFPDPSALGKGQPVKINILVRNLPPSIAAFALVDPFGSKVGPDAPFAIAHLAYKAELSFTDSESRIIVLSGTMSCRGAARRSLMATPSS